MLKYKTAPMGKRGQILVLASLTGAKRMTMREIATNTQIPLATCGNMFQEAKRRSKENGGPDLCAEENIAPKPNAAKGCNMVGATEELI
ncbi:hypothetical protein Q9L58_009139 [Maublancomyces gigas]|uniref:Uncharacterized protein n=1 Tax=Discina gigas TaxID=1032678 RepID=A0ABR3G842_9PEZI